MRPVRLSPALVAFCLIGAACSPTGTGMSVAVAERDATAAGATAKGSEGLVTVAGEPALAPRRGVVTAGEIDDLQNLAAFASYLRRSAAATRLPQLGLAKPVLVRLVGPEGAPAPGARYTLRVPGAEAPFHEGYAGPDGRIIDFPQVLGDQRLDRVDLRVFGRDGQELLRETVTTGRGATLTLPEPADWQPDFLDLVVVVDTTGSMADEIAFLQRDLIGIVRSAALRTPGLSIRYGLVAYRDRGDAYVVRSFGFTTRPGEMAGWLRRLEADGGGDYPEAATAALESAVAMSWRRGRGERLILHVADAPPHAAEAAGFLRAAKSAARDGVQIFGIGASGAGAEAEYLMRQASAATGGRYLFLTDDSGVGNAHAEPSVPCYQVTRLSQLLVRLLMTELTGRRQALSDARVLREVGGGSGGSCRD